MRRGRLGAHLALGASFLVIPAVAASQRAPATRSAIVPTLGAMSPAREAADERRVAVRAAALRARILRAASWAPLGDDDCEPGALRTFASDTSKASAELADSAQATVAALEYLVIARGVGAPLSTPSGRALLSTIVAWESGARAPRWDVATGADVRRAIAAGLSGRMRNPVTNVCGAVVALDTARILLPAVSGVTAPTAGPVPVVVYTDTAVLARVRARVLAAVPGPNVEFPTLHYVRVRTATVWGNYAVVSVVRRGDRVAGAPAAATAGGATYLFHRVGGEWRLLAVPRTWA